MVGPLSPTEDALEKCVTHVKNQDVVIERLKAYAKGQGDHGQLVEAQLEQSYNREARASQPLISPELAAAGGVTAGVILTLVVVAVAGGLKK